MHEYSDPVTVQNDDEKCNKLVRMRPGRLLCRWQLSLGTWCLCNPQSWQLPAPTGCGKKKYPPNTFCYFLSNRLAFQREILPTYLFMLYAHNSFITNLLAYCGLKLAELQ